MTELAHATGVIEIYTDENYIARMTRADGSEWASDAFDTPHEAMEQLTCRGVAKSHVRVKGMGKPLWNNQ